MKNVFIFILVVLVIVTGYIAATSNLKMSLEGIQGKTERVIRGDLTRTINATGEVRPARRIEVKSEASGEADIIAKQPGDRVRKGERIILLARDDEQRNVDRAKLDVRSAKARLEEAKLALKRAQGAELEAAKARVDQLREAMRLAKYRWEKLKALDPSQTNEEELLQRETAYLSQLAQLNEAKANLERARLAIPSAEQSVEQFKAAHDRALTNLGDAEKVLAKTDIVSPINGIVGDVMVEIGHVIQGGKTTLTGGTVLATVLDMERLIVGAEVDESDIERVRNISPAWAIPGHSDEDQFPTDLYTAAAAMEHLPTITVESFRDQEFSGIIERIYPEPRTTSGVVTYLVDVVITSDNRNLLLPGMRADVQFTSEHLENIVLCPNEAIREGPNGKLGVHIPKKGSGNNEPDTEFVPCRFGLTNGNYSQVLCDELSEGQTIYTKLPAQQDS